MKAYCISFVLFLLSCDEDGNKPPAALLKPSSRSTVTLFTYEQTKKAIDSNRMMLKHRYLHTTTPAERQKILSEAANLFRKAVNDDLFNYWQGTPWDYNGITVQPKQGSIACGYFVTTLLQDAGVRLNRVKLSTCPSLTMMKELTGSSAIKNLSAMRCETFAERIKNDGEGVYVIGLDFHTGFLVNDGPDCWFLHSNYINKAGVSKERLNESAALRASKTRYVASLTGSGTFLRTWLLR